MDIERERYHSSNRVSLLRFPILLIGSVFASFAGAVLLSVLFRLGWYFVVIVPFFVAMLVAGMERFFVWFAQCRNPWVAGSCGALAGIGTYLGYYYLSTAMMMGMILHPANLPQIIQFRMVTDVVDDVQEVAKPNQKQKKRGQPLSNWIVFGFELLCLTFTPLWGAVQRARRAFCEELQQWYVKESIPLEPGFGPVIAKAFEDQTLQETVVNFPKVSNPQHSGELILEYVKPSDDQSPLSFPMYLSIVDPTIGRISRLKSRWTQILLQPDEILELLPLFSNAAQFLSARHKQVQELVTQAKCEVAAATIDKFDIKELATVTPVAPEYRHQLQGPSYKWMVNLIGITPVLVIFAGAGLIWFACWFAGWGRAAVATMSISIALGIIGGLGIAGGVYSAVYLMGVPEMMWVNRRFRKLLSARPEAVPWLRDPAVELVAITPRESFSKVRMTMSSDVLLLRLRERKLEMLGDGDNYSIPADSIVELGTEMLFHPIDHQQTNQLWYVRLQVAFPNETRELLLSVFHLRFSPSTNARRKKEAEGLCQRLAALKER